MPELSRWLCLFALMSLTGCQTSSSGMFSWLPFRGDRDAKAAEFAALNRPLASVTEPPQVDKELTTRKSDGPPVATARVEELLDQGVQAIREQRLDDARTAFNEVLQTIPDHATAHHGLAMVGDLSEKWADAEYHYKQALKIRPRDAGLLNDLGYSYLLQNRFHEASRYLSQAAEINPQHEKAQENLAMLALRQGNRAEAETRLSRLYPADTARQHLARLEAQVGTADPTVAAAPQTTGQATSAPPVSNASFEEVRALAARERLAAEQERQRRQMAAILPPADPSLSPMTAGPVGMQPAAPGNIAQASLSNSQPGAFAGQAIANPPGIAAAVQAPPFQQPPQHPVMTAGQFAQPPAAQPPYPGNQGTASATPVNSSPMAYASRPTAQPAGDIIPVGASGAYSAAATANGNPSNAAAMGFPGTSPNGMAYSGGMASTPSTPAAPPAQNQFPLMGLNAGPGAIFPVGQDASRNAPADMQASAPGAPAQNPPYGAVAANQAAYGAPSPMVPGSGTQPITSVHPGTSSALNGAMFPQTQQTLPAQQWAVQQPQVAHAAAAAYGSAAPGQFVTASHGIPAGWTNPPAMPQQGFMQGNMQGSGTVAAPGTLPATGPGGNGTISAPSPNPLSEYERQLQQLNSEYNQTLQQLNRQAPTAAAVQAQY